MRNRAVLALLWVLVGAVAIVGRTSVAQTTEPAAPSPLKLSGYYKNLLQNGTTSFPAGQPYTVDLNRLRLEVKGYVHPRLALELQYDNEILAGDYLHTTQFALQKDMLPDQYWHAESNYLESRDVYGRHRLYRGFATLVLNDTDLRIGRQRIAWGTGRFWSPIDILNPISPIQLEREERPGVDALLVEHKLGDLSRVSAVYAARRPTSNSSSAVYWHGNMARTDFSLVAGRFGHDRMVGADIATQIGEAGLRSELTHTKRDQGGSYRRALVAMDYAFANTLTLSAELYYNGAGASDSRMYDFPALMSGRIQTVGRRYVGIFASYEITPLLKTTNYFVRNLHDRSRYFAPALTYSLRTNVDWTISIQSFTGSADSEYGRFSHVYYTQLQWFF